MAPGYGLIDRPGEGEYPQLAQVWEDAVRASHHFLPDAYIIRLRGLLLTQYLKSVTLFCTRDEQLQITGFAGVGFGKLEMLFISPAHQGQGLGRVLLAHAIERFGISELDVNEQNPQALAFYRQQGFEVIRRCDVDGLGQPYPILRMRLQGLK